MNIKLQVTRREFTKSTAAATAAIASGIVAVEQSSAAPASKAKAGAAANELIDTNVTLGRWPFRRLPLDETPALVAKLRRHGVTQAWAGTFDGIFHKDVAAANARLAEECHQHGRGLLVPFGSVNPALPAWEEDLRRCVEVHKMPGIRLHPNYHGYRLDAPEFAKLLSLAAARRCVVQIAADMEDERMQHRLAGVPHADLAPLLPLLANKLAPRVVVLNWFRAAKTDLVKQLAGAGASFDIATVESVGGVANLLRQISAERVLFGSHAPFFYFESATLKLKESALLAEQELALRSGNAGRLLPA